MLCGVKCVICGMWCVLCSVWCVVWCCVQCVVCVVLCVLYVVRYALCIVCFASCYVWSELCSVLARGPTLGLVHVVSGMLPSTKHLQHTRPQNIKKIKHLQKPPVRASAHSETNYRGPETFSCGKEKETRKIMVSMMMMVWFVEDCVCERITRAG